MSDTPSTVEDLYDEASGHVALGELPEAIALYRRCVALEPDHFESWHALGMALLRNGEVHSEGFANGPKAGTRYQCGPRRMPRGIFNGERIANEKNEGSQLFRLAACGPAYRAKNNCAYFV